MARASNEALYSIPSDMVSQYFSRIDENNSKREDSIIKCPLCKHLCRCFYCVDCVRNGNFTHSKKKCLERFADKKLKKYKFDEERLKILKRYESALSRKKEIENVKYNIHRCKENIKLLKDSIGTCNDDIIKGSKLIEEMKLNKSQSMNEQMKLSERLLKLQNFYETKNKEVQLVQTKLNSKRSALKSVLQSRIRELTTHIFPITKVPSQYCRDTSSSEEGQYAELEEAQKTTYIQGQWVITGSPMDDMQYSVVEPCIPSTGDYSAYTAWCAEHKEAMCRDSTASTQFDVAYGISAALAYTAHLVNILAFYMDAHVPKRSNFSDFCRSETPAKFLHHVAKLNANVVHLCLAGAVDVGQLSSHRTLSNLMLVLDQDENERTKSVTLEEKEEMLESLEDSITKDLLSQDESDSESIEAEYVRISDDEDLDLLQVPETPYPQLPTMVHEPSFVSSVFSFFKAATGQK